MSDGVKLPRQRARLGIVGADETALLAVAVAAAESLNDLPLHDDRATRIPEALAAVGNHRGPHRLAGAGVERHQPRIGGCQIDLVAVDRQVAHASRGVARAVGPNLVGPEEFTTGAVECLHFVHGVGEVDDAVVHERHRLIGSALVHVPRPGEPQRADVRGRDLVERAVAPGLVGAARHQPVAGRRGAQHLIGHRREARHLAAHVEAAGGWRSGGPGGARRVVVAATSASCASLRGGRTHACRHAADGHGGGGRERGGARRRAVGLQDEGRDAQVLVGAERGSAGRHRRADVVVEFLAGTRAPHVHERRPGQRRRFVASAQIGQMARRAACLIGVASRGGLRRGEDAGWRRLLRTRRVSGQRGRGGAGERHGEAGRGQRDPSVCQVSAGHQRRPFAAMSHPHKLPSGAFSLWSCT